MNLKPRRRYGVRKETLQNSFWMCPEGLFKLFQQPGLSKHVPSCAHSPPPKAGTKPSEIEASEDCFCTRKAHKRALNSLLNNPLRMEFNKSQLNPPWQSASILIITIIACITEHVFLPLKWRRRREAQMEYKQRNGKLPQQSVMAKQ